MNRRAAFLCAFLLVLAGGALAQSGRGRRAMTEDERAGVPEWKVEPEFRKDVFTFVRIQYTSEGGGRRWGGGGWRTDYPDSDLNFSYRLQQLTSLKVDPEGIILRLADPALFNYPFIYVIEPGRMALDEDEVLALRRYLLNGGFMMVDDFWGEWEWNNFYEQIRRVFPDREPQELDLDHPIFRAVFPLSEKPQVPSMHHAVGYRGSPYESYERDDADEVHYKGLFDDKGRLMAIICHNTDLGDGWEREGEDEWYFRKYAEKKAYPMGINIVFYAMTH